MSDENDEKPDSEESGLAAVEEPAPSREELLALRRELQDLREQLLRKRADFENFRKRMERDRLQASQDAAVSIFEELIPVIDNLDRALDAKGSEDALREGVELIRRQLHGILEAQGVTQNDPAGERFDPERHQALSHEAAAGFADGTIVETFQKAYFLGNRLIRPALVKVAKGGTAAGEGEPVH